MIQPLIEKPHAIGGGIQRLQKAAADLALKATAR
jgi:hypothetical protein